MAGKLSMALAVLSLGLALPLSAADVTGVAFRDFDGDGVFDAGEVGIAGLTVDVYSASAQLGTATTASDGSYSVPGGLPGEEVRVEFALPSSLDFLRAGVVGSDSASTLAFVTMPADGSDADQDAAFGNPAQHCQAAPDVVANCFIRGDQSGTADVLVSFPYTASGNTPAPGDEALENQIGTTWGMAYQRSSDSLFLSSYLKRHSGFGDGSADGGGAIYRIVDPADGTTAGISTFLNLNTLFGSQVAGSNPHPTGTDFSVDAASYDEVGKTSFGDMDISEDELTLWLVNLADRRLYEIPLGSDPSSPVAPTLSTEVDRHDLFDLEDCDGDGSDDLISDIDLRPFAVKVHDGLVYIGAVCSGESTSDDADLRALVFSFDPDTDTFTTVLDFTGMTYARGCALEDGGVCSGQADWRFWEPNWPPAGLLNLADLGASTEYSYPQPMLSDIEFAADGTMIVGFRDRFGDQLGFDDRDPDDTELVRGDGFGDILRATPNGMGQWLISAVEATDGTEFFDEDDWDDTNFVHFETSFGGLGLRVGSGEVLNSRMDPIDGAFVGDNDFSAGVHWTSLATGAELDAYEIYDEDTSPSGIFGKGNGLGDLELICEPPPLEVGNRLWCDDGDGVQDAGESGLAGVAVQLECDTGGDGIVGNGSDLLASTTTDAAGAYLFNASNVTGGVPPRTLCQLSVDRVTINGSCGATTDVTLADASSGSNADLRDSDAATIFGDQVGVEFTTGAVGENDHSFDLGFTPAAGTEDSGTLEIEKTSNPSGPVAPGETITYTIAVSNNSSISHTGIEVFAEPPVGLSYVAESTSATGPRPLNVLDRFETVSFANQDGRDQWTSDWIETDAAGAGAGAGNVQVTGGVLSLDDQPDTGGEPGVEREVDLSAFTRATLEFSFETSAGVDAGDAVTVDVSANGGGAYTTLEVITGITGASNAVRSFDISAFIAADTRVRFRVTNLYGGADEFFRLDDVRITASGGTDVMRVTEYVVAAGSFTGTTHDVTLAQNLVSDYFVIVQGSDGAADAGTTFAPDENFARLAQDPFGTGDLGVSAGANVIQLERGASVVGTSWVGVVTVVECLALCDSQGFRLRTVEEVVHAGATTSGSDTASTGWGDIGQAMLLGGFNGAGCSTVDGQSADHVSCYARLFPSGTQTINWTRDGTGATSLEDATSTVMVLEWGSSWTVQRQRVQGTVGGPGANDTGEYATAAIAPVVRANTWVWGTGHTNDNGIGDAGDALLITLGDGVNQNASESTVAVGLENADTLDVEVYALTHPQLAVDYRFKADGNGVDLMVDVTVDAATADRMALVTNGQNGTGTAFPRPLLSARYLDDTTVRLERRRSGQAFPAWVQGIDFSALEVTAPVTMDNDPLSGNVQLLAGVPLNLVTAADGFALQPGESLTISFEVTVDSPVPAGVTGFTCPSTVDSAEGLPDTDSAFNGVGQAGIIGDFVWFDLDGDTVQDASEPGISGVQVNLHAGSSCTGPVLETTVTDGNGYYLFDGLPAGDYCVEVYEATLPTGYSSTTANNPTTLTLAAGATDATVDFGYDADACLPEIDFERSALGNALLAGQVIDDELAPWGVTVSVVAGGGGADQLMVFSSDSPTGGDDDLGTPNADFGGPGVGAGGAAGLANENRFARGNLAVISEDGDSTAPNDNAGGGVITFAFDRDLEIDRLEFVDSNDSTAVDGGEIRLFDAGAVQIGAGIAIPGSGDNGIVAVGSIGGSGVRSVEVELFGAGGLDLLRTCALPELGARLGDRVWLDVDADGIQDVGEPGLANVEVTVFDAGADLMVGGGDDVAVASLVTDVNGLYLFTGLPAGTFYVDVTDSTVPGGLALSAGSTDPAALVTLGEGGVDLGSDFGYSNGAPATAVVGDTVWIDTDADGLQEPGEQGVANVTLALRSPGVDGVLGTGDDVTEATTSTDADGRYLFTGVVPGDYIVDVTDTGNVLTGYTLTTGPQSVSDPSLPFTVGAGDVYLLADFGYDRAGLSAVDDVVWFDADGDGTLDAGEEGLEGVTVDLLDSAGDVIASTVTDSAGAFSFSGLEDGDYTLDITDTAGVLAALSSTTLAAAAGEQAVTIAGADVSGINFGYNRPGVLGDFVWSDADSDGVQDRSEPGIAGVTVELYYDVDQNGVFDAGTDTLVDTALTDAFGAYLFEDLYPGTYFASIDDTQGALTGYSGTTADDEAAAGDQLQAAITASSAFLAADFGYVDSSLPDISGNVFEDFDRDGSDDGAGEPGIGGVTVALLDSSGNVLAVTTTDGAGDYAFRDLPAGDYTVTVTDEAAVLEDFELTSSLDAIDVTVAAADIGGLDFGYARDPSTAALGDFVWLDANGDGLQGGAENGIAGVTVELYDPGPDQAVGGGDDVLLASTVTDASGRYLFSGLAVGSYYAQVDTSTLPAAGASLVATTGNPSVIFDLSSGEVELDADFGFGSAGGVGAIGDFVWFDADADGVQDAGEIGIGGVEIEMTGPGCAPCTVLTDSDGSYLFTGLTPGFYQVTFDPATVPAIYGTTATNTTDDWEITLAGGEIEAAADFGLPAGGAVGSIGDFVWFDADGDGVQDAGEAGIEGVTLDLLDGAGTTVLASTVTDANGAYDFLGLAAGSYQVSVTDTAAVLTSLNLTGGSDPTGAIVLAAGQDYDLADFGYSPSGGAGIIGSHVWRDLDADGVREAGEPGFERVSVELWLDVDGNGVIEPGTDNLVRTELTDIDGAYEFRGLPAADYLVRPSDVNGVLTGFTKTAGAAGVDDNSQAVPYAVTLTSGTPNDLTADFGYSAAADLTIAGTAFFDLDGDGSLEVEDPGVEVVLVLLFADLDGDGVLDGDDALIDSQLSDGVGDYLFTDLPPGDFIVAVDATGTFVDGGVQTTQLLTSSVQPVTLVAVNSIDNDFGFTRAATLALVADLEADLTGAGLVVRWSTSSEAGTAGFVLERAAAAGFEAVVPALVASPFGSPQGARYRVLDPRGAAPGETLRYRLLERQRVGPALVHGPYDVRVGERALEKALPELGHDVEPRPAPAAHLQRVEAYRAELESSRSMKLGGAERLKLLVREDGLQRLAIADLAAALGQPEVDVAAALAAGELRLRLGADTVAHRVSGPQLEFIGRSIDSLYTLDQVYWLEPGPGQLMAELAPAAGPPAAGGSFEETLHIEEDLFAGTFVARDAELDYWHWRGLIAGHPSFGSFDFTLDLPDLVPATEATLEVHLRGASDAQVAGEHHASFDIDAAPVGETFFDDLADHSASLELAAGVLAAGANTLTVTALLDTGAASSFFYVDSFDVTYRRAHRAAAGLLAGAFEGEPTVTVEGFGSSAVAVFDVTDDRSPAVITNASAQLDGSSWRVTFGRPIGAERFLATSVAASPVIVPDQPSDLRAGSNEGDYLVLTVAAFELAAERLAQLRSATGKVVLLEDVMDEFNAGVYDPRAVRTFLAWAAEQWAVPPRHVVLAGAGHFDYRDLLAGGGNPLPPLLAATPFGLYASDAAVADLDSDGAPDLRIGRIPVLTGAELDAYIDKLVAYEAAAGPWADDVLLLADDSDGGGDFEANNMRVEAALPPVVEPRRIELAELGVSAARQQLFDALDDGAGLLHWIGHGGVDRLADEGLLLSADVPGLGDPQALPVLAALSCNIARFELPGFDALAEDMALEGAGGAIAVWAPSGLAFDFESHKADLILAEEAFSPLNETLGDIVLATARRFAGEALFPWSVLIYNLIGDPALVPHLPVADVDTPVVDVAISKSVEPATAGPGDDLTYRLRVVNLGPQRVQGARVSDPVPAELEACEWQCQADRGSSCQIFTEPASLEARIGLPALAEVVFTGRCRLSPQAAGEVRNEARVSVPAGATDLDPSNDTDAAVVLVAAGLIFADGFESGQLNAWN